MDMSCLKFVLCIPPIANLQTVSNVDKKLIEKKSTRKQPLPFLLVCGIDFKMNYVLCWV